MYYIYGYLCAFVYLLIHLSIDVLVYTNLSIYQPDIHLFVYLAIYPLSVRQL